MKIMNSKSKQVALRIFILIILMLCSGLIFEGQTFEGPEVQLAVVAPMVGTSNSVGLEYKTGVNAALKELPSGKLLGKKINVDLYDDRCTKSIAKAVSVKVVEQSPVVVIGHSCSGATIAAAPTYAAHKILQITPASTNPKVTELGINTIFRMIGRDDVQGELAAKRIATFHKGEKIGIFYFPGAYSKGLAMTAIEKLKKQGISPVISLQGRASSASYSDKIKAFIKAGTEVLYLVGGALDSGLFMRQARQMDAKFKVIGSDTMISNVFINAAGSAAENISFTFPPRATTLASAAQAVKDIEAQNDNAEGYTLLAYAAVQVWIQGVMRAQTFNGDEVAQAIRSKPMQTILGKISFDSKGNITTPYSPFTWYTWKDGKRALAE